MVALAGDVTVNNVRGRLQVANQSGVLIDGAGLARASVAGHRDFLADQAVEAGALVGGRAELLQHGGHHVIIGVEGVAVDVELHPAEQTVTGVLAVLDHVLVSHLLGGGFRTTGHHNIAKGINNVVVDRGALAPAGHHVGRKRRRALNGRLHGDGAAARQAHAAHHVVKEVTELRDAEGDASAQRGAARLGAHLVVLVADRGERLEVRIHVQNVRALQVDQGRRDVGLAGGIAGAHDVLDALVEQLSGHDHTIGLAIVGDELEDGTGGHSRSMSMYTVRVFSAVSENNQYDF